MALEFRREPDDRDQAAKHGNTAGDEIGHGRQACGAAKPGSPVDDCVGGKMLRASKNANEEEFTRKLGGIEKTKT